MSNGNKYAIIQTLIKNCITFYNIPHVQYYAFVNINITLKIKKTKNRNYTSHCPLKLTLNLS